MTLAGEIVVSGATAAVASGKVRIGTTSGSGNGTAGQAVTTTLKGTGSGPTTAPIVANYLEINVGGTNYWIPLMS
jgi:hypothetical protein